MKTTSKIPGAVGAIVGANVMLLIDHYMPLSLLMRVLVCGAVGGVTALLLEKALKPKDGPS